MLSKLWTIIQTVKEVVGLIKQALAFIKSYQKERIDEKGQEREASIDEIKKAQARDEFEQAQRDIVDSSN